MKKFLIVFITVIVSLVVTVAAIYGIFKFVQELTSEQTASPTSEVEKDETIAQDEGEVITAMSSYKGNGYNFEFPSEYVKYENGLITAEQAENLNEEGKFDEQYHYVLRVFALEDYEDTVDDYIEEITDRSANELEELIENGDFERENVKLGDNIFTKITAHDGEPSPYVLYVTLNGDMLIAFTHDIGGDEEVMQEIITTLQFE